MSATARVDARPRVRELAELGRPTLERLFCAGTEPHLDDLLGWEWRGTNPPELLRTIGFERFVKGFFDGGRGAEGYNVLCSQRDWSRRRFRGRDARHSYFRVVPTGARRPGCVLLDYAASDRNPALTPARLFRDFLVHPDPDDRDVLLGKAYLQTGALVPLSFFLLERDRRVESAP